MKSSVPFRLHRGVSKSGDGTPASVTQGRLEVAIHLIHGIVRKNGGGERDRVDLSKVRALVMFAIRWRLPRLGEGSRRRHGREWHFVDGEPVTSTACASEGGLFFAFPV